MRFPVRVVVKLSVERAHSALNAVRRVALVEQQFGQVKLHPPASLDACHRPALRAPKLRRMFALRLLGPLVLEQSGLPLALPTAKATAIVAWLALDGPAPRARMAAALWPGQAAAAARRNLRRELARLRELGADGLLARTGESLALADAVVLDVQQFSADFAAARHDAALALWRGPVADGLSLPDAPAFEDALAAARTRLARQRAAALEASAAAHEACGDGAAALRAIEALLADDPLQEAHQRTAMRLHAAAGRRAAALAGYERFAALLAAELGLAPMADTVALVRKLRQADVPPVTPAPLAPRPAATAAAWQALAQLPFVGRELELSQLEAAWQQGLALVIEGTAGIGKTRLASEFAGACGAFALAACRPGDAAQPYASFTRAVRRLAGQALSQSLLDDDWPRWVRDELAHVLPELGTAPQRIDSVAARERFFEACAEAWQLLAAGSFDAVIVDDWHLADAPSRALFDFIVRRRAARRAAGREGDAAGPREILLLRPGPLPAEHAPLAALAADGVAMHLRLAPLAPAAIVSLASQVSGAPAPPRWAERLAQASGGNPFAIGETLHHWAALSLWSAAGGEGGWVARAPACANATVAADELPEPLRHALLARVTGLPDASRRLLEAAALATEPFTPALLAGACALSEVQALDAVDAAMAAHLLREREGGFAFTHDLVQAVIEGSLGADRKRLVHRRLALGGEALRGAAALPPAEIARHWEQGGEPRRAIEPRLAAAESALALFSEEAAEDHWAMALADGATLAQQVGIAAQRGSMARNRDDLAAMQTAVAELDRLAEACSRQPETAASGLDAAIEAAGLLTLMRSGAPALARIEAVLATLPSAQPGDGAAAVHRRAMAMLIHSQALNGCGRGAEGAAVAEAALAAPGCPPQIQSRLLYSLVFSCFHESRHEQALSAAERSLALWRSLGNRRSMARAYANIGLIQTGLGRFEAARRGYGQALELACEMRINETQRDVLINLAYIDLHEGMAQAALDRLAAAWNVAPTFSQVTSPVYIRGMQVHGHACLGQLGLAFDLAEDAHRRVAELDAPDAVTDCVSMTLDLATDTGDFALADRWRAILPDEAVMPPYYRIKLAFNLVHLALARGELEVAEAELKALGDIAALSVPADRGYAALRHAELCLARGDAAAALAWLDRGWPEALHIEARALMLAARLRALALLAGSARSAAADAARAEAAALLGGPATVPAFAALALRRACGEDIREAVQALAAALGERPAQRECLLDRWTGTGLQR